MQLALLGAYTIHNYINLKFTQYSVTDRLNEVMHGFQHYVTPVIYVTSSTAK